MHRRTLLWAGPLWLLGIRQAAALSVSDDADFLEALARRLFLRECGGKVEHLVWWSPKEPFPSLGIAHFIWLPEGCKVPYEQTFPHMVAYVGGAPAWAQKPHAPWPNRDVFLKEGDSARIQTSRQW